MMRRPGAVRAAVATGLLVLATAVGGCGLLDVSDPTKLEEQDAENATGAELMRRRALLSFYQAESGSDWHGGVLTDEFTVLPYNPVYSSVRPLNSRLLDPSESSRAMLANAVRDPYQLRQKGRYEATLAMAQLRSYAPEAARDAWLGQMLAVRGYEAMRLGEDFCAGFPLHELNGFDAEFSPPLTTAQVFERALADLDSAVALATDSARILNLARVVRGRTLLDLARYPEAAVAVSDVPDAYVFNNESGGSSYMSFYSTYDGPSVADQEGGNGLDFISANDPRLPVTLFGVAELDGTTQLYQADKYADETTPIIMASGLEARLIAAEVELHAGQPQWLTTLNTLRTNGDTLPDGSYEAGTGGVAGLAPLTDPGSDAARLDLLFRERAFWLFGTGHRLADLRRLVRDYGRTADTVFPSGIAYGTATSFPYPDVYKEEGYTPGITECTNP